MSSTNKTANLNLNNWLGSDIPKREDFNLDNSIIDRVVSSHTHDSNIHVSASDKERWENPYFISTYFGDNELSRDIELECDFTPKWGFIFPMNSFTKVCDIKNESCYNYSAIVSQQGSTLGASLRGKTLTVQNSPTAVYGYEYRSLNEIGTTYIYIMFR